MQLSLERDHVSQAVVQQIVHTKFWFFFSAAARANHWDINFPIAKDEKIQAHLFYLADPLKNLWQGKDSAKVVSLTECRNI